MKKRITSLLLAAAMVFGLCGPLGGLLPTALATETAAADSGTYGEITWSYADGVLTLSGGALPETGDFPWLDYREEIWQVVLAEDITQVSPAAFQGLDLARIVFQSDEPPAFTPMDDTFWDGFYVRDIYYPDTWTDPEVLEWLDGIAYSEDREGYCGYPDDGTSGEYGDNLTWKLAGDTLTISGEGQMANWERGEYAPWAFYSDEIRHVVIADGVTSVGQRAFGIGSDIIPVSVIETGPDYDYPIESVSLGSTVQVIGSAAFAYLDQLAEIAIPA